MPKRGAGGYRLALAFALAIAGHGVFVTLLLFLSYVQVNVPGNPQPRRINRPVTMRPLASDQWAKNRGLQAPPENKPLAQRMEPKSKKEPEPRKETRPNGQVVDVAPGNGEEDPNARFLAEHGNKVAKETRAKDQTAFYRNAMPRHTTNVPRSGEGRDNVKEAQIAGNNGLANDDRPLRDPNDRKATLEIPNVRRREEIALKTSPGAGLGPSISNRTEAEEIVGNSNRLNMSPGGEMGEESSQGRRGTPGVTTLVPSEAVADKITGAAPNDHLRDVEEGDGTFLSTREWKYSSFFNRVKQSIGMHWDPSVQLRRRDPTGNIYGGRDRHTVVKVTLNEEGRVTDIFVEKSCGLDFLDLEAVRSFERAQPFPNPPPGLAAADAKIRFSFGFFVDMGGGPRMRLFRQAN
jgi:TonB family protein